MINVQNTLQKYRKMFTFERMGEILTEKYVIKKIFRIENQIKVSSLLKLETNKNVTTSRKMKRK